MLRFIRRLPGRAVRGAIALAAAAVILVIGATRTQVGRDALARRIEREFAQAYPGRLEIGKLTGNLLRQFVAVDVRVVDADGSLLLRADTVLAEPSWEDLVLRRIVVPRVRIHRPDVFVVRFPDGRNSLSRFFTRPTRPDSARSPWTFRSARMTVVDGTLDVRPLPSDEPVDTEDAVTLREVRLDLLADATDGRVQVDVFSASAFDPARGLRLSELRAQLIAGPEGVAVNEAAIRVGDSRVTGSGTVRRTDSGALAYDVVAAADPLDFDQIASVIPRFPLRGRSTLGVEARGEPGQTVVSRLEILSGRSHLRATGSVRATPDSLHFDMAIERSRLSVGDLRDLAPLGAPLSGLRFDSLDVSLSAAGSASRDFGTIRAAGRIDMAGDAGRLGGLYDVARSGPARLRIQVDARAGDLDLSAFRSGVPRTALTGTLAVDAVGTSVFDLDGNVAFRLRRSRIGGNLLERAELVAFAYGDDASASLSVIQPLGNLRADLAWRRAEPSTGFLRATWSAFDVGPFVAADSVETRTTGRLDVRFEGSSEAELSGSMTLAVDTTLIRIGSRSGLVPAQGARAELWPADAPGPRLLVEADAATVELSGDVRVAVVRTLAPFWALALDAAARREWNKPYPSTPVVAGLLENAREIRTSVLRGEVAALAGELDLDRPFHLSLRLDVFRPDLLAGWPGSTGWGGRPSLLLDLEADADVMAFRADVRADSLRIGPARVTGFLATVGGSTRFEGPAERDLVLDLVAHADTIRLSGIALPDAELALGWERGSGTFALDTGAADEIGPVVLRADLASLADRNRVTVNALSMDARNFAWKLARPSVVDIFRGGLRSDGLRLTSASAARSQSIVVRGAWSASPEDSLLVDARGVNLEEITRFATLNPRLGGILDARVALTGGSGVPVILGEVHARDFVLDRRLLGNVSLRSTLVPGRPDVALELDISPPDSSGLDEPDPPDEVRPNRLRVAGTVRLPDARRSDPGAWNLDLDATRADLFFLKYIFTDSIDRVRGYLTGTGRVRGDWRRPVFDVEFTAVDGGFSLPVTGGTYSLEGEVGIDREGIRIRGVRVADTGGGSAVVSGSLFFNEYRYFSFDLRADLDRFLVIETGFTDDLPFYGSIRGTGTATLTGPLANANLRIPDGATSDDSELFIPIVETAATTDASFIVFADSTGRLPDLRELARRPFLLARRATVERRFLDGLDMDLNIFAPRGSLIHLVIDPLLGDVINAESTGRVQVQRSQGNFGIFGQLEVEGGDYLFTAGEVFVRRFLIEEGGTITWESDPIDARLDIAAAYRTRASWAGLDPSQTGTSALIPLVVELRISGRVLTPAVDLSLAVDRSNQNVLGDYQALEARLNNPEKSAEFATSVLLTNSFQLTTESLGSRSGEQLAFNSVSQLVSAQLNRFLSAAVPNVDVNFGLQGERAQDLDITYGVALRLLDERLIIRSEGVYQGSRADATNVAGETLQGEFVVEVRLSPTVSVEVFFRREGDVLQSSDLTSTTGAGLTYQTEFTSWRRFFRRLFGRDERAVAN